MPKYNHDLMHCSQGMCSKRKDCYRYWLSKEMKNHGYEQASFYYPDKPVLGGCEFYIKKEYFE